MRFRDEFPFEKRAEVATAIRKKYPDRVPIIVERAPNEKTLQEIRQRKFLIPSDATAGKMIYEIRKHVAVSREQAMFIYVGVDAVTGAVMPNTASLVSELYARHASSDGFLYVHFASENTFGQLDA